MSERKDLPVEDPVSDSKGETPTTDPKRVQLDLLRMDLTVEEVEERIHPSETNVFDK